MSVSGAEATRECAVLANAVLPRLDVIGDEAAAAVRRTVPAYRDSADPALIGQVSAHCRSVLRAVLSCLEDDRDATVADFGFTTEAAFDRVRQGISLSDFLRAYRVSQRVFWRHLMSEIKDLALSQDAVGLAVDVLLGVMEAGSSAAAAAYIGAQQHQVADLERVRRDLMEDLISGRAPVIGPRESVLEQAGVPAGRPYRFVSARQVGSASDESNVHRIRGRMRAWLVELFAPAAPGLIVARHDEVVAMVRVGDGGADPFASVHADLIADGVTTAIGVSTVHSGSDAAVHAYREAAAAAERVREGGVLEFSQVSVVDYLVANADQGALRLISSAIIDFVADDLAADRILLDTFDAYVSSDLKATAAAALSGVHVNTVYARLERIAERTGVDLHDYRGVTELAVSVALLRSAKARTEV